MTVNERAPFATFWEHSRGRFHPEPPAATRTPFQRDRDRLVHCSAFRRLMHKTQVFVAPDYDHFRTRLTHSLEVAQIARAVARSLKVDEDLTEVIALAHDLGHPPFGHTGEDALDEAMAQWGGFDHNDQALRVLVKLERRYPDFEGLNLTWETLEGLVKHNGPLKADALGPTIAALDRDFDLALDAYSGLEAQVAALADDIAYNHHDLDDGLRAGLFTIQDLCAIDHVRDVFDAVGRDHPDAPRRVVIGEAVRRMIGDMVADLMAETTRRLAEDGIETAADVRANTRPVASLSPAVAEREKALKAFLFDNMYRNKAVNQERAEGRTVVLTLFRQFLWAPETLPGEWRGTCDGPGGDFTARVVADYIAGMTDRYAKREYRLSVGLRSAVS